MALPGKNEFIVGRASALMTMLTEKVDSKDMDVVVIQELAATAVDLAVELGNRLENVLNLEEWKA